MACRLASRFCSLRHGPRFLSSSNQRAGKQMRSTAQADASQGKTTYPRQKALRLAFCCVIPKAQFSCLFTREGVGNRAPVLFLIQSDQEARSSSIGNGLPSGAGITCEEKGGVGGKSG